MVESERRKDAVRRGVEVMTAWLEMRDSADPDELMWQVIERTVVEEGIEAQAQMTMGLQAVAAILLVKLEAATEKWPTEILQDIAINYE